MEPRFLLLVPVIALVFLTVLQNHQGDMNGADIGGGGVGECERHPRWCHSGTNARVGTHNESIKFGDSAPAIVVFAGIQMQL